MGNSTTAKGPPKKIPYNTLSKTSQAAEPTAKPGGFFWKSPQKKEEFGKEMKKKNKIK